MFFEIEQGYLESNYFWLNSQHTNLILGRETCNFHGLDNVECKIPGETKSGLKSCVSVQKYYDTTTHNPVLHIKVSSLDTSQPEG